MSKDKIEVAKALSIQQPWAWLIANGYKDVENRKWKSGYIGSFWIHAGNKIDEEGIAFVKEAFPEIPLPASFETGGIVGVAHMTGCVSESPSPWFFGPYGFVIKGATPIPFIPYKGMLKFFKVELLEFMTAMKNVRLKQMRMNVTEQGDFLTLEFHMPCYEKVQFIETVLKVEGLSEEEIEVLEKDLEDICDEKE